MVKPHGQGKIPTRKRAGPGPRRALSFKFVQEFSNRFRSRAHSKCADEHISGQECESRRRKIVNSQCAKSVFYSSLSPKREPRQTRALAGKRLCNFSRLLAFIEPPLSYLSSLAFALIPLPFDLYRPANQEKSFGTIHHRESIPRCGCVF